MASVPGFVGSLTTLILLAWDAQTAELVNPIHFENLVALSLFSVAMCTGVCFWMRTRAKLVFERLAPLSRECIDLRPGEKISEHKNQAIVFSPAINALLESSSNTAEFVAGKFEVHPLVRQLLPSFVLSMPETSPGTFDDPKVRMCTDLTVDLLEAGGKVKLQETSYFRDRLSNTLANYRVQLNDHEILNLRRDTAGDDGRLVPLKASSLSNQLGASTLLITADSAIVFLRQGIGSAENPGRLAPAGSGSFDLPGTRADLNFQTYAREEAKRELCEECGLSPEDVLSIQLCGFGRYLNRNGKPEIFCIAVTCRDSLSIQVPMNEDDYQHREIGCHQFNGGLSKTGVLRGLEDLLVLLECGGPGFEEVSGALYWNVLFARDYLAAGNDARTSALFSGGP